MQISESQVSAKNLTKCSKMSEVNRLHETSQTEKDIEPEYRRSSYGQGARLKFFKGQFNSINPTTNLQI